MLQAVLSPFDSLPEEILVRILHFCDNRTILRFATTCKNSLDLVTHSTSLQLHIELEVNDLEIIKGSCNRNADYATILEDLRRYRDAWLNLDLEPPLIKCVDHPRLIQWDLRDGALIKDYSASGEEGVMDSLEIIHLNSPNAPSSMCFNYDFQDFTLDLAQQLAVLVAEDPEYSAQAFIHLRSTVTGLAHPKAQKPLLTVELDFALADTFTQEYDTFHFKVMGTLLLTQFTLDVPHRYELLVWNWVEGVLLHRISCDSGICDFIFLDKDHLVLSSAVDDEELDCLRSISLLVFNISALPPDHYSPPDAHFDIPTYPTLTPILELQFPKVLRSYAVDPSRLMLRSDPVPDRVVHTTSAAFACTRSATLGMLVSLCDSEMHDGDELEETLTFCVFISGDHLLKHLEQSSLGNTSTTTLPWHEWGENATRWFAEADDLEGWTCWISGSRFVHGCFELREGGYMLSVFDFNTTRVRRHSDRCSPPSRTEDEEQEYRDVIMSSGGLVASCEFSALPSEMQDNMSFAETIESDIETTIRSGFEEPIVSRLPYRIVTKVQPMPIHEAWMIDGDHIIGIYPSTHVSQHISVYGLRLSGSTQVLV